MEQNPTGENRTKKNNNINNNASMKSPYPQKNGLLKKKKTHWWKTFPFIREEHTAPLLKIDMNL